MTVVLPEPVPLEPPPGDPDAVAELVRRVAGASFCLAVLEGGLRGPAGSAPSWHGADAAAAAEQVGTLAALAENVSAGLCTAAGRLTLHGDLLEEVRARIAVLAAEQDEDFRAAWGRLAALPDPATELRLGGPVAAAVIDDVTAAEARRRREHAALLEEVAAGAAATGRVLAECSAVVGGTGRAGDAGRAVAHLALLLPGWGAAELAARGEALADALWRAPVDEREALAREVLALAGSPAFAAALLAGLGVDGVQTALVLLGDGDVPADGSLATVLAAALGAAVRTGGPVDPVGDVLDAVYVDPDVRGSEPDVVAVGMGAVLAAGLRSRSGGPAPSTVLDWGRQLVAREIAYAGDATLGRAVDRAHGSSSGGSARDPLALVAESLARAGDASAAAELLSDGPTWARLLSRTWDDDGAVLGDLVTRAGADPGVAGDSAVRAGLAAIGAGIESGQGWAVDRGTAATVAPALAGALAAHVEVAVDVLWPGVGGGSATDSLRGLGYLTAQPESAGPVERAVTSWAAAQPVVLSEEFPALPAFAVVGAYVAVEEYGQQIDYVRDEFDRQAEAERRARTWDWTVGVVAGLPPGPLGLVTDGLQGYLAQALHLDGTWDAAVDTHHVQDRADAVHVGLEALPLESLEVLACAASAGAGFDRATAALGRPEAPRSPVPHWWEPAVDAVVPGPGDALPFLRNLRRRMVDEGVLPSPDR